MSQLEVNKVIPQSGTTLTVGEAGDTVDISNATLTANINASSLTSGTIPDARFPATLPALDGSNLTNIQIAGGYTACDSITVTNTDTFALTAGGSPVSPESANNCIVSLNGVIQAPGNSYTISGSNIIFSSALSAGSDVIDFITVLGTALNVGTVSDGTITDVKTSFTVPTITRLTSGTGTYTLPSGAKYIIVEMAGGGGGGGGGAVGGQTTAGGNGGNTTLGTSLHTVGGGIGGGSPWSGAGGAGGTTTLGAGATSIINQSGTRGGGTVSSTDSSNFANTGEGGGNPFNGGGKGVSYISAGTAGIVNTGGGGSGGGGGSSSGAIYGGTGGGGGGYMKFLISSPSTTYAYAIGAGGTAGTGGSGANGGAGGSGVIIIQEFYV